MDWEEWSNRSSRYSSRYTSRVSRQQAARERAQAPRVLTATHQSPDAQTQDYRMHMLLSTLMLIAALIIANLR